MINMKIDIQQDKIIVYYYKEKININNTEFNEKIKSIFIKLIKKYTINLFGFSNVDVYHNNKYGLIIEINKVYDYDASSRVVDLKIKIYKNVLMYLEFDDYFFFSLPKNLFVINNKYYLNVDYLISYH